MCLTHSMPYEPRKLPERVYYFEAKGRRIQFMIDGSNAVNRLVSWGSGVSLM